MSSQESVKEPDVSELPGVGPATAEKLAVGGFDTVVSIAVATPGQLTDAAGVTEVAARKIIRAARDMMDMGFVSADEVLAKRQSVSKISVGAESFDQLLGGGFETGSITECFGEFGSAKTQIAHILSCSIQKQFPGSIAVYIDTENTFRPERILELAPAFGLEPEEALKQIKVAKAYNSDHQMLLAEKVEELIKEGHNVKLVVVDSLTSHFRAEFVGRGTLAERQQKLNKHMSILKKLADMHNICVFVTNQVMAKPDAFFGDPTAAIGGHIVAHASAFRIYLRKGRKGSRVAKLIDAPNLPDGECAFFVKSEGLEDIEL